MKYKKLLLISFCLVALIFSGFFFRDHSIYGNKLENIKINGNNFKIEIVDNSDKLSKGLGNRNSLCEKCGMLFEFSEEGKKTFWMKGMKFDLDIIWIKGEEIVYIAKNVSHDSLKTITPQVEVSRVLEINAGLVDKYGIEVGDRVYPVK